MIMRVGVKFIGMIFCLKYDHDICVTTGLHM